MKSAISLAVIGIFLFSLIPVQSASAASSTVILVSDNPADMAMARLVANYTGYPVVVTGWGVYNVSVSSKVLSYSPSRVIIIGGPLAVPDEYTTDFKAMNVSVMRWGGENRYATNLKVISGLKELGVSFSGAQVLAPGNASPAISTALETAVRERSELLYFNSTTSIDHISGNVTVVLPQWMGSPGLPKGAKIKKINVTERWAQLEVKRASSRLEMASNMINGTNSTDITRLLKIAEANVEKAQNYLSSGDYRDAYTFASIANSQIDTAMRLISLDPEVKLEADAVILEFSLHGLKQMDPAQYMEMQNLLKEYKEALKKHDYKEANRILLMIRVRFFRAYSPHKVGPVVHQGNATVK